METRIKGDKIEISDVELRALLPHKSPFVMIDKVIELTPGKRALGIKNVSESESQFQGHFPVKAIMPVSLLVESLIQLSVVLQISDSLFDFEGSRRFPDGMVRAKAADKAGSLKEIVELKILSEVIPGDRLILSSDILEENDKGILLKVCVMKEEATVIDGKLLFKSI